MSEQSRIGALASLWAAHRELSQIEYLECRLALFRAARWLVAAVITALGAWLSLNAAVLIAFREQPLAAAAGLVAGNGLTAAFAIWRASRLLGGPFFALTRREATNDVQALWRGLS